MKAQTRVMVAVSATFAASILPANAKDATFCGTVKLESQKCTIVHSGMVDAPIFDIATSGAKPTEGELIGGSGQVEKSSMCNEKYVRLVNVHWKKVAVCALNK